MELWVLLTAFLFWLGYTLYLINTLLKSSGLIPHGLVCVLMGNQAGEAEWFIRSVCKCEGVLNGSLELAVAVDKKGDSTARIVEILSAEKDFFLVGGYGTSGGYEYLNRCGLSEAVNSWKLGALVMDVRGMGMEDLIKGPLRSIDRWDFERQSN